MKGDRARRKISDAWQQQARCHPPLCVARSSHAVPWVKPRPMQIPLDIAEPPAPLWLGVEEPTRGCRSTAEQTRRAHLGDLLVMPPPMRLPLCGDPPPTCLPLASTGSLSSPLPVAGPPRCESGSLEWRERPNLIWLFPRHQINLPSLSKPCLSSGPTVLG